MKFLLRDSTDFALMEALVIVMNLLPEVRLYFLAEATRVSWCMPTRKRRQRILVWKNPLMHPCCAELVFVGWNSVLRSGTAQRYNAQQQKNDSLVHGPHAQGSRTKDAFRCAVRIHVASNEQRAQRLQPRPFQR